MIIGIGTVCTLSFLLASCGCKSIDTSSYSSNSNTQQTTISASSKVDSSTSSSKGGETSASSQETDSSESSTSFEPFVPMEGFCVVTFLNYDGSLLIQEQVLPGSCIYYQGPTPLKPDTASTSFAFSGWDHDLTKVTEAFTTTAQFTSSLRTFNIRFLNYDSTVLDWWFGVTYGETIDYEMGTPIKPSDAFYDYVFSGWYPEVTPVTRSLDYMAQFKMVAK